ncbi:hypothetical protein N9D31_03615 [Oligoflexaceae bacterium]|nr:hypothetical protein [Oligoflexaceae bacterium]
MKIQFKLLLLALLVTTAWACRLRIAESDAKATNVSKKTTAVLSGESVTIEINEDTQKLIPNVISECMKVAKDALQSAAEGFGIEIDLDRIRVVGFSSNVAAKYIWWSADVTDFKDSNLESQYKDGLRKMTQKPPLEDCF